MAPLSAWISAARMRILPASAIPTIIGIVLAAQEGHFDLFTASITLLCAMMLQTTSNLLNDLYGGGSCRSLKVKSVVGYMQCDHIGHFLKVPGDKTFKK